MLFDTGLDPRARPIARLLSALGRQPDDVRELFLTHAHPDHVAGAAAYPSARVWIGAAKSKSWEVEGLEATAAAKNLEQ